MNGICKEGNLNSGTSITRNLAKKPQRTYRFHRLQQNDPPATYALFAFAVPVMPISWGILFDVLMCVVNGRCEFRFHCRCHSIKRIPLQIYNELFVFNKLYAYDAIHPLKQRNFLTYAVIQWHIENTALTTLIADNFRYASIFSNECSYKCSNDELIHTNICTKIGLRTEVICMYRVLYF